MARFRNGRRGFMLVGVRKNLAPNHVMGKEIPHPSKNTSAVYCLLRIETHHLYSKQVR